VDNFSRKAKNLSVALPNHLLFYTSTHLKLSSLFYTTQLVDIFAYELPTSQSSTDNDNSFSKYIDLSKSNTSVLVYHFHSLLSQNRIFLFSHNKLISTRSRTAKYYDSADSITELFPAANWLEREVSEMHGVSFVGKKDLRNLMLQYGDTTAPFQKSFPTIGVRELFYNPIKDTVVQSPVSVQL
jgi:NADH:ubiquinone oxidoreductase subunit C